jgi:hypothetical protein
MIVGAAGLALVLLALVGSTASAASPYPPNTVINTYVDPRYGAVSVVTDQWGNLININAATGQRIYPAYADIPYAYTPGYYGYTPYAYAGYYPSYTHYPYTAQYPYGYTGVYSGNVKIVAPNGTPYVLGAPYRVSG